MEPVNPEQLYRELNDIKTQIREGFDGTHDRQDVANGRTRILENKVTIMWLLWGAMGMIAMAGVTRLFNWIPN